MTLSSSYPPKFSVQAAQITKTTNQHCQNTITDDDGGSDDGRQQQVNVKHHKPLVQLLRTCKKIHEEASPIVYSQNTFAFDMPRHFRDFYKMAGRKNVFEVRHLQINFLLHVNASELFEWSNFIVDEAWAMDRVCANCPKLTEVKALYYGVFASNVPNKMMQKVLDKNAKLAREAALSFWNTSGVVRSFPPIEPEKITNEHIYGDDPKKPLVQKVTFKLR